MAVPEALSLGPESFSEAFPFHFAFDEDLQIVALGRALERKISSIEIGQTFTDCFRVRRPTDFITSPESFSDEKTLFLIEVNQSTLVLRGQIIRHTEKSYLFLGSPWFSNTEDVIAAGLTMDDFAIHDPVIDLLQLLQSQKMAFQDIKQFTEKLKTQKEKLSQANQDLEQQNKTLQQTEQRLRQKEAEARKLALVAAGTDNAVIITDAKGLTEWVNAGFTKQTGYELSDIAGKKPGRLLQGEDTDSATAKIMGTNIAQGKSFHVEIINYTKSRESRWIEIECQPIRDESGVITNFIAIESDITARKHAEQSLRQAKQSAEEANRLKSEFLATVSHEIRTPMNGVLGMSELLLDSKLDSKQLSLLQTIRSSADSLLAVINDVLDLSKIESGKLEIHEETFSLRNLIDNVLGSVCERCSQKGVELNAIVAPDIIDSLLGDRGKLQQILINLIGNAAKFTERGEVRLDVHELSRYKNISTLEFTIIDSGIGFDPSESDKIFESFRQSDSGLARKHGGTGLGLSISKKLTEILGGTIKATGQLNQGAQFTCRIPMEFTPSERKNAVPVDPIAVQVSIEAIHPSSAKAISNHLSFLNIPHLISDGEKTTQQFFNSNSTSNDLKSVIIRDEAQAALERARQEIVEENVEIITLVSLGGDHPIAAKERVLLKPLRFLSLKNSLQGTADGLEANATPDSSTSQKLSPRYKRILVAEDNPINRQLIQEVLHRLKLGSTIVKNGNEVLERLENEDFDCILMDCQMPELDGLETTREIRKREAQSEGGKTYRTTIIAMTANALVGDRERCLNAGMDDYMAKPIRFAEVKDKLLVTDMENTLSNDSPEEPKLDDSSIQSTLDTLHDELGPEAVFELTQDFLEDAPIRLENIKKLQNSLDIKGLRLETHSLKSVCQTYGLLDSAERLQAIETATIENQNTDFSNLVDRLIPAFEVESSKLRTILNQFKTDRE